MTQEEADKIGYVGTVDNIPRYIMGPRTMGSEYIPLTNSLPITILSADEKLRMMAVQRAVELYNGKPTPNLKDLNEKFKELYTEIYNFYVNK